MDMSNLNQMDSESLEKNTETLVKVELQLADLKEAKKSLDEVVDEFKESLLKNNLIDEHNPLILRSDEMELVYTYVPERLRAGALPIKKIKKLLEKHEICQACYTKITVPKSTVAHVRRKITLY